MERCSLGHSQRNLWGKLDLARISDECCAQFVRVRIASIDGDLAALATASTRGHSLFSMNKTCSILRPSAIVPGRVPQNSVNVQSSCCPDWPSVGMRSGPMENRALKEC